MVVGFINNLTTIFIIFFPIVFPILLQSHLFLIKFGGLLIRFDVF